jgi:hypothetical protein
LILLAWLALSGFNYWREHEALRLSGLDLSRISVDLIYSNDASVHFGADSVTEYVFELPPGHMGTGWCGKGGYSTIGEIDLADILRLPGAPRGRVQGCTRHIVKSSGTVFTYVLFTNKIAIKIMA